MFVACRSALLQDFVWAEIWSAPLAGRFRERRRPEPHVNPEIGYSSSMKVEVAGRVSGQPADCSEINDYNALERNKSGRRSRLTIRLASEGFHEAKSVFLGRVVGGHCGNRDLGGYFAARLLPCEGSGEADCGRHEHGGDREGA